MRNRIDAAESSWLRQRWTELVLAFALLTRLPLPVIKEQVPDSQLSNRVWAFPIVGAVIGAIGGVIYLVAAAAGIPSALCAAFAIAATVLATGCFHEDGFSDFWDGVGGGRTRDAKLEIMRDSRIGAYGATALIFTFGTRWAALAALTDPAAAASALVVTHATGRGLLSLIFLTMTPARKEGLAASGERPPIVVAFAALAGSFAAPFLLWPFTAALTGVLAAMLAIGSLAIVARRQLGGYTGDALGASEQMAEIALLTVAATLRP